MDTKNFTIKTQASVQKAQEIAMSNQHQAIETGHLLKAILMVDEDVISYGLKKVNANVKRIGQVLDGILEGYPKISGSGSQYLSNSGQQSLIKANTYLKEFNDEFVTTEHLFLGIIGSMFLREQYKHIDFGQ